MPSPAPTTNPQDGFPKCRCNSGTSPLEGHHHHLRLLIAQVCVHVRSLSHTVSRARTQVPSYVRLHTYACTSSHASTLVCTLGTSTWPSITEIFQTSTGIGTASGRSSGTSKRKLHLHDQFQVPTPQLLGLPHAHIAQSDPVTTLTHPHPSSTSHPLLSLPPRISQRPLAPGLLPPSQRINKRSGSQTRAR